MPSDADAFIIFFTLFLCRKILETTIQPQTVPADNEAKIGNDFRKSILYPRDDRFLAIPNKNRWIEENLLKMNVRQNSTAFLKTNVMKEGSIYVRFHLIVRCLVHTDYCCYNELDGFFLFSNFFTPCLDSVPFEKFPDPNTNHHMSSSM